MTEREQFETSLNEVVEALKGAFTELITNTLSGAEGDVLKYGEDLTAEYAKHLWLAYLEGDAEAERNLGHLNAQVALLAIKHGIITTREMQTKLRTVFETAVTIGVKALVAAAIAAL